MSSLRQASKGRVTRFLSDGSAGSTRLTLALPAVENTLQPRTHRQEVGFVEEVAPMIRPRIEAEFGVIRTGLLERDRIGDGHILISIAMSDEDRPGESPESHGKFWEARCRAVSATEKRSFGPAKAMTPFTSGTTGAAWRAEMAP